MRLETTRVRVPARSALEAERTAECGLSRRCMAAYGAAAIEVGSSNPGQNDLDTAASDAIANILHRLDRAGLGAEVEAVLERAERDYRCEVGAGELDR